ncbi:MAG TPA: hypothetical protein VNJ71_04085 [Gemmatimonadales bacterium]|jgi:predicted phosphoribosyltransferase|nr:hypothetical protein [Gemmatimonadales bacterium]
MLLTRTDAGRQLAGRLQSLAVGSPVVLALSRSGARVADAVAEALGAPLDMLCARRLEVPGRPHSMFGAVANGVIRLDAAATRRLGLPAAYVDRLAQLAMRDAEFMTRSCRGGELPVSVAGRTAILVDDGFAEPILLEAAAAALRELGARHIVLATPALTDEGRARLESLVDQLVVLAEGGGFPRVCDTGFAQTTVPEVRALIRRSRERAADPMMPA